MRNILCRSSSQRRGDGCSVDQFYTVDYFPNHSYLVGHEHQIEGSKQFDELPIALCVARFDSEQNRVSFFNVFVSILLLFSTIISFADMRLKN